MFRAELGSPRVTVICALPGRRRACVPGTEQGRPALRVLTLLGTHLMWHPGEGTTRAAGGFHFCYCPAAPEGGRGRIFISHLQGFRHIMLTDTVPAHKMLNTLGRERLPLSYLWCWGSLASLAGAILSV